MTNCQIRCSDCGAYGEAGCECGAEYISASAFAARAIARNPEKSSNAIAKETGVSEATVRRQRTTSSNDEVQKRTGLDGKKRKVTRRLKPEEAPGYSPKAERCIDTRTGENISRTEAIKREATKDDQAELLELRAEVAKLRAEMTERPTMDDFRRMDAFSNHVQRIVTDIDTYNLFRRCLHPDSRNSVTDELLHKAWLAFRNLEARTYDRNKIPPPLPADLTELFRMREAVSKKNSEASKERRASKHA